MALRFRRRGNGIQVLRATSSSHTDRPVIVAIGSIPSTGEKIPDNLINQLTEIEKDEIAIYIKNRQDINTLRGKLAALDLEKTVNDAGQYLLSLPECQEKDQIIENFSESLNSLRKILLQTRKKG